MYVLSCMYVDVCMLSVCVCPCVLALCMIMCVCVCVRMYQHTHCTDALSYQLPLCELPREQIITLV